LGFLERREQLGASLWSDKIELHEPFDLVPGDR
jgi:hypothetical protein